jgi:hypothetical protein
LPYRSLRRHRSRLTAAAAATSVLAALGAASTASAATVTATGDDGNPVSLATPGVTVRQMDQKIGIAFPDTNGQFSAHVAGPDGTAVADDINCYINANSTRYLNFRGNGTYTVTVTNFASYRTDATCARPLTTETYTFTIASSAAITPPPGPFLTRAVNSFHTNTLSLPIQTNPGATGYDVQYGLGSPVNPDGSLGGSPQSGYVNTTTGTIDLTFTTPGTYTVVYRAHNGDYGSPWSAPVNVVALVPFEVLGVSWPDSRGPSYLLRGTVTDRNIRGRISLALARKGKHNKYGSYKSLGKTTVSSRSTFSKRFTERRTGTYRLRIHYAGSAIAPARTVYYTNIRITRRLFYK